MGVRRGVDGTTTAIAALCLSLALCLAGCGSPDGAPPANAPSAPTASQGSGPATQEPVAGLVPAPRPAPPPSINKPSTVPLPTTSNRESDTPGPSATQGQAPRTGEATPSPTGPSASGDPAPQVLSPLPAAEVPSGPAVYFVAIGDGGSRGVRFGCDDSLVAVRFTASAGSDPLAAAMGQLLAPDDTAARAGLYNALSGSALRYVSGYLDGSTAVVNLSGSLLPGGVCDHPRIETQLTQTAVAATGASQAAIYIDGRTLADVLSLR